VLDRVSDDAKTYLKGVRSRDSALSQALTAVERKVVVAKRWRGHLRLGEDQVGVGESREPKEELQTCNVSK